VTNRPSMISGQPNSMMMIEVSVISLLSSTTVGCWERTISVVNWVMQGTMMGIVAVVGAVLLVFSIVKTNGWGNIPPLVEHNDQVIAHVSHVVRIQIRVDETKGRLSSSIVKLDRCGSIKDQL
jgi:hypothetical protein